MKKLKLIRIQKLNSIATQLISSHKIPYKRILKTVLLAFLFLCLANTAKIAQGASSNVTFLKFIEGDPELPGDEIFVNYYPGIFTLDPPFALARISDGITITVFPVDAITDLPIDITNFGEVGFVIQSPKAPDVQVVSGGGQMDQIIFNGVTGVFTNISQAELKDLVNFINEVTGQNITLDDLYITKLELFKKDGSIIQELDAAAIGLGQNTIPSPGDVDKKSVALFINTDQDLNICQLMDTLVCALEHDVRGKSLPN